MGRVEEAFSAEAEPRAKDGATVHDGNDQHLPVFIWKKHGARMP